MATTNWQMREVSKNCSVCGQPFKDGQPYQSVLEIEHNDLLCLSARRSDCCLPCWQARPTDKPAADATVDSYSWQGAFRSRDKKDSSAVHKGRLETMLAFLSENVGAQERRMANLLFALAVILERKKVLAPCPSTAENPSMLVFTHTKSGESFLLRPPENIEEDTDFINTSIHELSFPEEALDGQG